MLKRSFFIICVSIFFLSGCGNEETPNQVLNAIKNEDFSKAGQIYDDAIHKSDNKDELNEAVAKTIEGYIDEYYGERVTDGDTQASFQTLLKHIEDVGIYDRSLNEKIIFYEDEVTANEDSVDDTLDNQSESEEDSSVGQDSIQDSSASFTEDDSSVETNIEQDTSLSDPTSVTTSSLDVNHGQYASITIKTTPGANGVIEVDYNSGPSTAAGLYPQTADGNGMITWTWKVGTRTAPGIYPVIITVDGLSITETITVH